MSPCFVNELVHELGEVRVFTFSAVHDGLTSLDKRLEVIEVLYLNSSCREQLQSEYQDGYSSHCDVSGTCYPAWHNSSLLATKFRSSTKPTVVRDVCVDFCLVLLYIDIFRSASECSAYQQSVYIPPVRSPIYNWLLEVRTTARRVCR